MDKTLLLKVLGKKDSVDLGDMVFNLKEINLKLRDMINLNLNIDDNFIIDTKKKLNDIYVVITGINDNLKDSHKIQGYTNSKKYLLNFTNNLCSNILGLINSLESLDIKNVTYYNNVIIDLILIY